MKYCVPKLDIAMFDCEINTAQKLSQIHGTGNAATQELEQSSKSSGEADTQVFKFIWE